MAKKKVEEPRVINIKMKLNPDQQTELEKEVMAVLWTMYRQHLMLVVDDLERQNVMKSIVVYPPSRESFDTLVKFAVNCMNRGMEWRNMPLNKTGLQATEGSLTKE